MNVVHNNINITVAEDIEKILDGNIPEISGMVCDTYISTAEGDYTLETRSRGDYNSGVRYFHSYKRIWHSEDTHMNLFGFYAHQVETDDKTLVYIIPLDIYIAVKAKKIVFNKWSNKSIRLFEFHEDNLQVFTIGKIRRKVEIHKAVEYIAKSSTSWFAPKFTTEINMIKNVSQYPYNQSRNAEVFIKCIQSPILYKFMRRAYLLNTTELVNDYKRYFNKDGKTIEELTKIPLNVMEEQRIDSLKDYCSYIIANEEIELSEQNSYILNQFSKEAKRNFIDLINFYELNPDECINYIDNCKTYQGLSTESILSIFSKVCFYNALLEEKLHYPDSLKWTHNKLFNRIKMSSNKPLSVKAVKLIYDKEDKNLKHYLAETGVTFNFVDKGCTKFFNVTLDKVKHCSYTRKDEIETISYEYDNDNIVIYRNCYHTELASINRSVVPEIEIAFIKKELIYKITPKQVVTGSSKALSNYACLVPIEMVEKLIKEPIFENTGVHILFNECIKEHRDGNRTLNMIMKYMKSYRHLECLLNRGLTHEVVESCDYLGRNPFDGKNDCKVNSIKKVLYYLNKAQIDYIANRTEDIYHSLLFYNSCKYIYDQLNYIDIEIMDLIASLTLSVGYCENLFGLGFITKQNIHTVFKYILNLVNEDVGNVGEVVYLYRDYINMSNKLNLPNSKRYPTDLIKAHDVAIQAYNAIKDEILSEEFKKVMKDYQQYNYINEEDDYCIVVPKQLQEIVQEGVELNHCVKSYTERIIARQTLILFVRKKETPNTPYFTLEIYNDSINQLRGQGNCAPPQEVAEFVNKWFVKHYKKIAKETAKVAV